MYTDQLFQILDPGAKASLQGTYLTIQNLTVIEPQKSVYRLMWKTIKEEWLRAMSEGKTSISGAVRK